MAEESAQEKTEDPTQKRLDKAAEDGQVLQSRELMVFSALAMGLLVYFAAYYQFSGILLKWSSLFEFDNPDLNNQIQIGVYESIVFIIQISAFVGVPGLLVVLLTQGFLAGGINFAPKAASFKASKINPIKGLKDKIFSVRALVELIKSITKVTLLGGVAFVILNNSIKSLLTSSDASLFNGLSRANETFLTLFVSFLIVLAVIALLDVLYQRYEHLKKLKMSIQDVKDENKQTEGSPEVKAKIRRLQMQTSQRAAEQKEALAAVPEATAIITNPTHFAVALKYVVGEKGAPLVLAMGRGKMAEEIIKLANDNTVPIFQSPILARALYFSGEIGQEIREELYSAVAAVLAFIFRLANGEEIEPPQIEVPESLQFSETGAPLNA